MTVIAIIGPLGFSSYAVPPDCNLATVEVIGGGAGTSSISASGGGGGGAYSKITGLTLTPSASVAMSIGVGGGDGTAQSAGGDTWFNGASMATPPSVGAKGGSVPGSSVGGVGGLATGGFGTTKFNGGSGGAEVGYTGGGGGAGSQYGNGRAGGSGGAGTNGGGGGSAGGGSDGATGGATYGGAGGNNNNGTDGGAGGATPTSGAGRNGFVGAGGGGGWSGSGTGGTGGPGREYLTSLNVYVGAGGGGGGEYSSGTAGGHGGLYGGGAGARRGAVGAQGIIVITYTPVAAPDTTPPTLTGTVTISGITTTTSVASWPAGSDVGGVASYETSLDGTSWTDRGNVLTYTFTGLTPAAPYTARVRAKDGAGLVSTPVITGAFTTASPPAATALLADGPSGGTVGAPSATITITANGALAASKTITASDGAGGSFVFSGGATLANGGSVTCTYNPPTAGAKTLTFSTSDASLTPVARAFTASTTTYSMTVGPFGLSTGSGPLLSTPLSYTVWPSVDTGAISGTAINGTATTHATTGALVIAGLAASGSYLVSLKNADGSGRWHNLGSAA